MIGSLVAEIFEFENVYARTDGPTDGRTPDRPVYYKLTFEPSAQLKKISLSIKYGIVKKFIKHIRCILMLFGHRRAGNIGLNLGVAVQMLTLKVCK